MNGTDDTPRHPIGVASTRSGVSPDLIRAWERRYGATEPARDAAGQRLYSDADLERLRLLRLATEGGRTISQVAGLDQESLSELVRGDEAARAERIAGGTGAGGAGVGASREGEEVVAALEARARSLDGEGLEAALRGRLVELGFVRFVEEVAAPLLRRLGDGWHAGVVTPAQEHLATVAVRRSLEGAREAAPAGGEEQRVVVVGTVAGERHEAGALAVAAAARLAGCRVVYLGVDLPVSDLADAARASGADAVCVSGTYRSSGAGPVERLRALRVALPAAVELFAGGAAVAEAREELEGLGIRCPAGLAALTAALRE